MIRCLSRAKACSHDQKDDSTKKPETPIAWNSRLFLQETKRWLFALYHDSILVHFIGFFADALDFEEILRVLKGAVFVTEFDDPVGISLANAIQSHQFVL